ncbi:hypothetical protein [Methanosphaerula palustris]|uniref:Uncharacterized protein n=1 Tax=Methanosphaerula palustris (strain ATCC BAA-1556 / DSM 19958 / E1-9c) TaxID=521011 RepID=B8GFE0_METPE|nr:hypothetical protein [Methanosphaerula palustris]ACL15988.1 hypothetical protein Mpal_0617 [Methanosphaerula palustris E1-9c]
MAAMLDMILAMPATEKRFMTLVQDLLPFIEAVTVSQSPDQALQVVEIPASSLSDGTITLLVLIATLYFTNHPLRVFKDPGTPVHPNLNPRKVIIVIKEIEGWYLAGIDGDQQQTFGLTPFTPQTT